MREDVFLRLAFCELLTTVAAEAHTACAGSLKGAVIEMI